MADATLIDAGTRIDGRIAGDGDVTVRGRVDGEIALSQRLVVADGGFVQGTVEVAEIVVDGALEADVVASELIVLSASARVVGSLTAPAVRIEDGAQFSGEVVMDLDATASTRTSTARSSARPATSARASTGSTSSTGRTAASGGRATSTARTTRTTTTVEESAGESDEEPDEPEEPEEPDEPDEADEEEASEPDITELSASELEEYTVKELREELRERDLQVSGTKDELIERLQEAD